MGKKYVYVDTDAGLLDLVEACRRHSVVTVDTEFQRTDTYYPIVGLIQVYDGDTCFVVDPLILSIRPLADLLGDESVLKVFHACSEDLEVFEYSVGQMPKPVFDTQIAAAVLGTGFSMSYQNLVEHHLSINVPKEETRSDWLKRPLTEAQLDYAALDVIHLYDVYQQQSASLETMGRAEWVAEECARLADDIAITVDPFRAYLKIRSAARMKPEELHHLRELSAWRELTAREQNLPRNRVVDEKTLVNLSRKPPYTREGLHHAGMSPRQVRKFSDDVLQCLERAGGDASECWPPPLAESNAVSNERLKALKQIVAERAEELNIAPEMLARRRNLEELLRSNDGDGYELPASLEGWRRPVIGEKLLEALQEG